MRGEGMEREVEWQGVQFGARGKGESGTVGVGWSLRPTLGVAERRPRGRWCYRVLNATVTCVVVVGRR